MIKDFKVGDPADGYYLVKACSKATTAGGSTYFNITLQDSSGSVDAKKWNANEVDNEIFEAGKIVYIYGEVTEFKDKLQVRITDANLIEDKNFDMTKVIPSSKFSENELKDKVNYFISTIKNTNLSAIVKTIIKEHKDAYLVYPAAVRNHHDYARGLIEHTVSMCEVAEFVSKHYEDVNYDLLISGCLLHDIGKIVELSGPVATQYTFDGNLLGHLYIGANLVSLTAEKLGIKGKDVTLLEHLILSHHGKLEFGSPITPATREALLLSMIDDMDAKMKVLDKAFDQTKSGEFSDKIFALDSKSYYKE